MQPIIRKMIGRGNIRFIEPPSKLSDVRNEPDEGNIFRVKIARTCLAGWCPWNRRGIGFALFCLSPENVEAAPKNPTGIGVQSIAGEYRRIP
jgi:hypothetical protein